MTTRVTVDPANHATTVKVSEGPADDQTVTTETLNPGDAPREYWLYGTRVITVCETPEGPAQ